MDSLSKSVISFVVSIKCAYLALHGQLMAVKILKINFQNFFQN